MQDLVLGALMKITPESLREAGIGLGKLGEAVHDTNIFPLLMTFVARAFFGVGLLVSAGCGRSAPSGPSIPPLPATTLTAPNVQPPMQGPDVDPRVTYDPCTRIPDSFVSAAGYNPASRQRFDEINGATVTLGCQFRDDAKGPGYEKFDLWIASTNVPLDQRRQQVESTANNPRITPIRAHGRTGFQLVDAGHGASCTVYLETKAGYVVFNRRALPAGPNDVCDKMTELVDLIEPTIGADN
ncbi:hypothetical protein C5E41_03585 [Nocardia nova]|nr:hypothetical protein C5E41_03585 [Nocardia nova]